MEIQELLAVGLVQRDRLPLAAGRQGQAGDAIEGLQIARREMLRCRENPERRDRPCDLPVDGHHERTAGLEQAALGGRSRLPVRHEDQPRRETYERQDRPEHEHK